ncbi:MAG: cob(I)yrinic acid a,c-diamide adenosyltransferase [Synergistes sp.]|nr:cob(I)yrinic acid a,c-diamide adenosyltransferase [Synergistes sp.]
MADTEKGMVHIYTGCGKGKSTAAFGLAMRCAGNGGRVFVIQFRKARPCGEHKSAAKLGIEVIRCEAGRGSAPCAHPCPLLSAVTGVFEKNDPDLVILDEVMAALKHGCVDISEVRELLAARPEETELVMTGRDAPDELIGRADLVTEMKKIKHYYDKGRAAKQGIEF